VKSYWIDIEQLEPEINQSILYISEDDFIRFGYNCSYYWPYEFGVDNGVYIDEKFVEYNCDSPPVKIKYWFPAMEFKYD